MYNLIDLTNRKIIVTGASSGIGKQTAITLSRLGAKIVLIARREEQLRQTMQELDGEGHSYYLADLSLTEEIEGLVKRIVKDQGALDGMIYAAGISIAQPFVMLDSEKVERLFRVNFFGFYEFSRQISKKHRYNPGMRIVGVSSSASMIGDKGQTAYSATKAAMNGAMRGIAHELCDRGICINTVAPGMTATEMYKAYVGRYGADGESNQTLLKRQYLGIAETEDIANAIAFLVSPAARFITGVTLPVDGGYTSC